MPDKILAEQAARAIKSLFGIEAGPEMNLVQKTRKEFEGDLTIVLFPLTRLLRKSPQVIGEELGNHLLLNSEMIQSCKVISGYLNIILKPSWWMNFFLHNYQNPLFGIQEAVSGDPVVIEYSSPNTNKPLHLGHIRNNLIGYSLAQIISACGNKVIKVNLVNDRGIHICKSMLAWKKWSGGETPESTHTKGDHLIGKYYVLFETRYREEVKHLVEKGLTEEEALRQAPLIDEAQRMLKKWEEKDPETIALWHRMNHWAYDGFDETYRQMGVDFDKIYYESDTYLLGKQLVEEGLKKGALQRKEDGSVWADLTENGLDWKLLIRADGTSVYMTQDLGTAQLRYDEFHPQKLIYVVGNEQIYHFDVLKIILKKLGRDWADHIYHLSYGMVELPEGKMKSREGKIVDADDLMQEMSVTAERMTRELGKMDDFDQEEASRLYRQVGLAALKYFILKVDPMKTMVFNPEESIDFNGNTGPFIQYTYARIQSVLRKASGLEIPDDVNLNADVELIPKEIDLVKLIADFPSAVKEAGANYSPSVIASYVYDLAREYNQFYHDHSILKAGKPAQVHFRIELSRFVGNVIKTAMGLLGIEVPEKM
ncbi:MAG: arginine--tRNA ligase [Bacteroidales bacterium]|nr:arginine--tRNA ligase [Lentimicrobiaceae bacterium]MDD5695797.1 arginine--tRNA ligase [Bacteroidales bacterium]